jgi:serine/threonine protein kinase
MTVNQLHTLFVKRWQLVSPQKWGEIASPILGTLTCEKLLDAMMTVPSEKWTWACEKNLVTEFLRDRILRNDCDDLFVGDRYFCFDKLGGGGQGETHLAFDKLSDTEPVVVVKSTDVRPGSRSFQRLEQEYLSLSNITAFFFPKVKYFDRDHGRFVMEYFHGPTLEKWFGQQSRKGRRPTHQNCTGLSRHLADGLGILHRYNLVHRDLKPLNVILRKIEYSGSVRACIVDFGFAKEVGSMHGTVRGYLGTSHYTAPECQSDPQAADAVSDIYSLACTVFTLFVGAPPFFQYYMRPGGSNRRAIADYGERVRLHEPDLLPRISHFRKSVSPELDDLVFTALAWEADDRTPKCGDDFARALGRVPAEFSDGLLAAPALVYQARKLIHDAYHQACNEPGRTFSSKTNLAKLIQEIRMSRTQFEEPTVTQRLDAYVGTPAASLRADILALYQRIEAKVRYAGNLDGLADADRWVLVNELLNAAQPINVMLLKLFHALCD